MGRGVGGEGRGSGGDRRIRTKLRVNSSKTIAINQNALPLTTIPRTPL